PQSLTLALSDRASACVPRTEIHQSLLVRRSPMLIADSHVLRRLPVPRHPPCALTRFISVSRCDSSTPQHTLVSCQRARKKMIERGKCGRHPGPFDPKIYSALQKGGDPAAGSPTATLLRLRPSHRVHLRRLRPCGSPTGF